MKISLEVTSKSVLRHCDLDVGDTFLIEDAAIKHVYMKIRDAGYTSGLGKLYVNTVNLTSGGILLVKNDRPLLKVKVEGKATVL